MILEERKGTEVFASTTLYGRSKTFSKSRIEFRNLILYKKGYNVHLLPLNFGVKGVCAA